MLERIIKASSNPNDIVLDAFCGCGTALVAAENLGRQWIGIDISPTACRVMAKRLRDVCHIREDEKLWRIGRGFVVRDLPWTRRTAAEAPALRVRELGRHRPRRHPEQGPGRRHGHRRPHLPRLRHAPKPGRRPANWTSWTTGIPIQVKQKDKAGRPDIDAFEAVMTREDRTKGFFVAFDFSADALTEIDAFFRKTGKVIVAADREGNPGRADCEEAGVGPAASPPRSTG